jgi:hypothetical protein
MGSTTDPRAAAAAKIGELVAALESHPGGTAADILEECRALARAVSAFHMEGIRFRMFNVDRLVSRTPSLPPGVPAILEEVRKHLEAAGFHTRSHQAPA